jgi:hypothetical protein
MRIVRVRVIPLHGMNAPPNLYPQTSNAMSKSIVHTSPQKVQFLSHLTIGGLTYTVASKHIGNSHTLIKAASSDHAHDAVIPIHIDYIFKGVYQILSKHSLVLLTY